MGLHSHRHSPFGYGVVTCDTAAEIPASPPKRGTVYVAKDSGAMYITITDPVSGLLGARLVPGVWQLAAGVAFTTAFRFAKAHTTAGTVAPAAAGQFAIGVAQRITILGGVVPLLGVGMLTSIVAGAGGLAAGDRVASDASGGGIVAATGTYVLGVCVSPAAAGATAGMVFQPGGIAP